MALASKSRRLPWHKGKSMYLASSGLQRFQWPKILSKALAASKAVKAASGSKVSKYVKLCFSTTRCFWQSEVFKGPCRCKSVQPTKAAVAKVQRQ
ncbi:hypothetical protein NPIL_291371 [Nephila pilipes]|uniref:Uncharacterized protein n=1 Tax=Nephila pilipes TaxID=299642 RepID=A0A8X6TSZ2_NEPPI|nr:hypothetical protein NPIL_291371 [Nephila pilipes]